MGQVPVEYRWQLRLVVVVQRRTHLVAVVQRWTRLVAVVQRQTRLVADFVKLMVLGSAVLTSEVCLFLGDFFPGSYFLPLTARWSFFSATAKSLATSSCGYLELKSSFLIKKCAAAAKHLMGCLKAMLENFEWNGHGSIKLQQFSSVISSGVSLSFSNLSSVGADKWGGIFN